MPQKLPLYVTHPFQSFYTMLGKVNTQFEKRNLGVINLKVPPYSFVVVRDAELLKKIYNDPQISIRKYVETLPRMIWLMPKGGVINAGTPDCMTRKRKVQRSMKPMTLSNYINKLPPIFDEYFSRWQNQPAPFLINHDILEMVVRATFQMFFSKEIKGAELAEMTKMVEFLNTNFVHRIPDKVPTPNKFKFRKYGNRVRAIFQSFLDERRANPLEVDDMLAHLVELKYDDGTNYPDAEIIDEICNVYFGGTALAAVTTWATYWVSDNEEVRSKLASEANSIENFVPENLLNQPYTSMVIKEILRLTPTFWCAVRQTPKEIEHEGYVIPTGSNLLLSIHHTHRNPAYWERAEQFYPEHFLPENEAKRTPSAYFPFGKGSRICIGQHLTNMFLQVYILSLVKSLKFTHEPSSKNNPFPVIGFENFPNQVRINVTSR